MIRTTGIKQATIFSRLFEAYGKYSVGRRPRGLARIINHLPSLTHCLKPHEAINFLNLVRFCRSVDLGRNEKVYVMYALIQNCFNIKAFVNFVNISSRSPLELVLQGSV